MKSKITLFLVLIMLPVFGFMGNAAFAQTVSGVSSNTGCSASGIITTTSTGLGVTPEYQLLKSGIVIYPIPGDASQFSPVSIFTGLVNGTYTVNGRANSLAKVYTSASITVTDGYVNMSVSTPTKVLGCKGGTGNLTSTVIGGKAPYRYSIALQDTPGVALETSTVLSNTSYTFGTVASLSAGNYVVSVTDDCGTTITGATSLSDPTVGVKDIKLGTKAYFSRTDLLNCNSVINVNNENGFVYSVSGNPITLGDRANFTWKLRFQNEYYGQGGVKDGPGYSLSISSASVPVVATRDAILADENTATPPAIVLMDACGNENIIPLVNLNKTASSLVAVNCQGTPYVITHAYSGLDCFPMTITFTNAADPSDVIIGTAATGNNDIISGFKPGAKYNFTYVDAAGYTKDLWNTTSVTMPAASTYGPYQRTVGVQPNLNRLGYGVLTINMPSILPGQTGTVEVIVSSNPGTVPVGTKFTNLAINSSGYMSLPAVNSNDPVGYWPKGTYTLRVSTDCGTKDIVVNVEGYVAALNGNTITQICGGFNYVMNTNLDDYTAYQVVIVSGPNNVGDTRDFASKTASMPFEGLTPGKYVFGLRIKGGATNVLTQEVDNPASVVMANDKSKTGGYVCTASGTGTLSISASTLAQAPNDVLSYALSIDGGKTFGEYQSGNSFSGLFYGSYFFRVKDGCGNVITGNSQIGVASTPIASADGVSNELILCSDVSTTIQLDVNILGASSYLWTGPGITAANQNLKNPVINSDSLLLGDNNYACTIVLGAPCNTTSVANLIITKSAAPKVVVNNPTACSPDKIDLASTAVTSGSDTGLSYTYFADSNATIALTNFNAVSSGTYYIKATNGKCTTIVPVVATINPLPVAAITYTDASYCNRGNASVTQTGTTGGTYSGDTGLVINSTTGLIDLESSSIGTHTITYTFSNGTCSNTAVTTVAINATTLPGILSPITAECSVETITAPTLEDACAGTLTASTNTVFPITKSGQTDVTWTFNYGNGYTQNVIQKVYISDKIAPVVGLLSDLEGECSVTPIPPTTTDNCDTGIITGTTTTAFPITKQGLTVVTWKFQDSSGNFSIAPQNVFIKDVTAPVMPVLADVTGQCSVTPVAPTTTDNCAGVITGTTTTVFPITKAGKTVVTWTFDDGNGNSVTADQNVIITEVVLVGEVSTKCAVDGSGYVVTLTVSGEGPFKATGNGAPGSWSGTTWTSDSIPAGTAYNVSLQDSNTCNTLVVADIAPTCCVFEVIPPTFPVTTLACYDQLPTAVSLTKAEFETLGNGDGRIGNIPCGVIEITAANSSDPNCNGNVIRTYTVTEYADPNNNKVRDLGEDTILNSFTSTQTFMIQRADFVMPANTGITVACASDAAVEPTVPEVKDNCGNTLTPSLLLISADPACDGEKTYTYTFTDCAGNTHDWVYTYTIDNTVAPTGKAPADLVLQCISDIPVASINEVTNTIANCQGSIAITVADTNNGGTGCKGNPYIVTRTFTLTDCGGLVSDLVQKITVEDTTAPVFVETLPANITIDCAADIPVAEILTAVDNCSTTDVAYEEVRVNGSCSGSYTLQRIWRATDSCGNETSHTQIITVVDTTAPVFVEQLPESVVNATCETIPSVVTLTTADNCGIATVEYTETKVDGSCSSKYDLIRSWVASDDCGNQNKFTQTIHVSCLPEIYNAISPNGDGINDTFKIKGIDCYPNNTLRIYNRYGVLVYDKEGYDNITNPFEGFSDGRATLKRSDKLPTGTYFYTLEYSDDNKARVEKAGYLYINNN
jgi:gliding motility-associated-like protein